MNDVARVPFDEIGGSRMRVRMRKESSEDATCVPLVVVLVSSYSTQRQAFVELRLQDKTRAIRERERGESV